MELQRGKVNEAIERWKESVEQHHEYTSPATLRELGVMHRIEDTGIKDSSEALKLYQEAAMKGSAIALHSIGILFKQGT